ncbi:MAG TPA: histidine kinase [Chitinophagaceae bacterium]|nr:histidine kinase [Chitinophagaceae bacterium]
MNKKILSILAAVLLYGTADAQKVTKTSAYVEWDNYSTSFTTRDNDTTPFIVTAIPYSGKYAVADFNAPLSVSYNGAKYMYQSTLNLNYRSLATYDSSAVCFFVPYVHASNAHLYEYRVLLNAKTVLTPWSDISTFTADSFQLYTFKKNFAQLGWYKTTWDNFISVELRKKGTDKLISAATVYWKQIKPALLNIYTGNELNDFLLRMKKPYDMNLSQQEIQRWRSKYASDDIDSLTHLPKKLVLQSTENNVIFYLNANIYKRDALEYQLEKDGKIITTWKPNDFDNNVIWLNNLPPGNYVLYMRFSAQRHNVTQYPFEIKPAWNQTTFFKILTGGVIAVFFSFVIVLFALNRQKRKTAEEQSKKARLSLELKALYSQLNPHFVFNALNSIQGLINKNNIAGANKYLSKFGSLMRSSLTNGDKDIIPLEKEIATLETYLSLEQLRFGFQYSVQTATGINTAETDIPALLLQPLVENAVKHGVAGLEERGQINISFTKQGADMLVMITDNGSGFIINDNYKGVGLKLTRERITLLNEILKERRVILSFAANSPIGTIVHLVLKNWWL